MLTDPIVVGTDGSATAGRAVDRAAELAGALGAPVHVVSSYATSGAWMASAGGVAVAELVVTEQAETRAQQIVAEACARLAAQGLGAEGHVCSGEPPEALITVAQEAHAQMIVVGNRGMSGARRMLGSVPNRVSHHAPCAVLIVPTNE